MKMSNDLKRYIELANMVDKCIGDSGSLIDMDTQIRIFAEDVTHRGKLHYWPLLEVLQSRLYNNYSRLEEPQRVSNQLRNLVMGVIGTN